MKDRFCRIPPLEGSHSSQSIETECEMVGGWCRGQRKTMRASEMERVLEMGDGDRHRMCEWT